jgi:hypothetical protein
VKFRLPLAAAATALAAVGILAVPASAQQSTSAQQTSAAAGLTAKPARMTPLPMNTGSTATLSASAASYSFNCFGYVGTVLDASFTAYRITWADGRDECFAIAPSRSIWHTWPGAGGWKQMPGNGHADEFYGFFNLYTNAGDTYTGHAVQVHLLASDNLYCNYNDESSNKWSGWKIDFLDCGQL